jgi:2-oxoglutarate ferredoxin oxidoreductase subunit beta
MNTYGMHGIHGRATAIASGLKVARPDLSVWVITGDGDSLSIGGNHLTHLLRRNIDCNVLLFNNEIYGLTTRQYSPTSVPGLKTKSSPTGALDYPVNPPALALGAGSTFIARAIDREPRQLKQILVDADKHKGTSFVEIYQNCPVFNDGAFHAYTDRGIKDEHTLLLTPGEPLIFAGGTKGIKLNGFKPEVVEVSEATKEELWIHDPSDKEKAFILTSFDFNSDESEFPRPFGVLYSESRSCYEDDVVEAIDEAKVKSPADLDQLLAGENTWLVG